MDSSNVSPGQAATAAQYNNLRQDVLDGRSLWIPCTTFYDGTGYYNFNTYLNQLSKALSDAGWFMTIIHVPEGFSSLEGVYLWCNGTAAGTMNWTASTVFATEGEVMNANTDSDSGSGVAFTAEMDTIDLAGAFTGIAENDIIALKFTYGYVSGANALRCYGIEFRYQ